jgi:predicted phage terminase large subunit-like protein
MITRQQIIGERCRRSFLYFVQYMLEGFDIPWFHLDLAEQIQDWSQQNEDNPFTLMLSMPPGHAKSTYARLAAAWLHGCDPTEQIFYISYSTEAATGHLSLIQELMLSERYNYAFPNAKILKARANTETEGREPRRNMRLHDVFDTTGVKGGARAYGLDGGITGGRASTIIIDDHTKNAEDAARASFREKSWRTFVSAINSRKVVGRPLKILMLATRWHLDDLSGRVKDKGLYPVKEIRREALKETFDDDTDPRREGEALWPEAISEKALLNIRRVAPEVFQSLYQNNPAPEGGNVIKVIWTNNRYSVIPNGGRGRWVQAWDLRLDGSGASSSNAVGQLWFSPENSTGLAYLVDQVKGRWDSNETLTMMRHVNKIGIWQQASEKYIENKALGKPVISMLKNEIPGLLEYSPGTANKRARWESVKPFWAAGNVYLPQDAEWLPEFINEHILAPSYPTDDQIDCSTIALTALFVQNTHNKETYTWL